MLPSFRPQLFGLMLALVVILPATPARAGEVDKYLPDDTEVVVTVHTKQIVESPVFKKLGLEQAKQAIKDMGDVNEVLKDLGFDPFTDLDRLVVATPGGDDGDKILMIAHGHFDLDKFKAKGNDAAKTNGDILKIHKREKGPVIYEVKPPDQDNPIFVALPDKGTVLVSPGKDYIVDALKKIDNKTATLKSRELATLIEHMDRKQSLSIAMIGSALARSNELKNLLSKDVVDNLEAAGGGITIEDDVKLEFVVTTKNAKAAKEMTDKINDGLNDALLGLGALAKLNKDLAPAVDIVKAIKTTAKEKSVTIKGEVTPEQIEKLAKGIQGILGM
jgi:hypothetical protein